MTINTGCGVVCIAVGLKSLYLLIWDFLLSQIDIWTTTTWSNVWVVLPKSSWYEFLIWTPASKVFASNNILQYLCDFIHALTFVIVSKCWKSPKLTNVVIKLQHEVSWGVKCTLLCAIKLPSRIGCLFTCAVYLGS